MATIAVTIPDELLATHERFKTENGEGWLDAYVTEKLKELRERHQQADRLTFQQAFEALPQAEQDAIRATLATKMPKSNP